MSDELNVSCVTVPYTVTLTKANVTRRWWLERLGTLSSLAQCETNGPSEVMAPLQPLVFRVRLLRTQVVSSSRHDKYHRLRPTYAVHDALPGLRRSHASYW